MIKLDLPEKPAQLTADFQTEKTLEFQRTQNSVWKRDWLKEAVLNMAFGKCCYSEILLDEESKYMEIEHFYPKSKYPEKVLEWGNLLPSCKKCNIAKDDHDVEIEPIVNPFADDPKEFLYFKNYRYFPKNEVGERTILVLDINHHSLVKPRFKIGDKIMADLEDLKENIDHLETKKQSHYIRQIKKLLEQGNRKEEYAALTASTILNDDNFSSIEKSLKERGLWDNELEELKRELIFCAL